MWHYLNWITNLLHSIVGWLCRRKKRVWYRVEVGGGGGGAEQELLHQHVCSNVIVSRAAQRKHNQLSNNPPSKTLRGLGHGYARGGGPARSLSVITLPSTTGWNIVVLSWAHMNSIKYEAWAAEMWPLWNNKEWSWANTCWQIWPTYFIFF